MIEKVATVSFCTLGKCTYSRLIKNKLYDTLLKGKQVLLKPLWVTKYFIKSRNKKGCQYWKDILSVNAFICAFIHGKIYTYPNYKKAKHDSLIYMTYYCSEKIAAIKNPSFSVTEQLLNNCEQYYALLQLWSRLSSLFVISPYNMEDCTLYLINLNSAINALRIMCLEKFRVVHSCLIDLQNICQILIDWFGILNHILFFDASKTEKSETSTRK